MKHITTWTPDTHPDVKVEYEWDDQDPPETRVHTFKRFIKEPTHARFTGRGDEKFLKLIEENQRKNFALKEVLDALPAEYKVKRDNGNGVEVEDFKHEPKWSLDDNGDVEIEMTGDVGKNKVLTRALHAAVQSKLGNKIRVKE